MTDVFCLRCSSPARVEELFMGKAIYCTGCAAREVVGVRNEMCNGFGTASDIEKMQKKQEKQDKRIDSKGAKYEGRGEQKTTAHRPVGVVASGGDAVESTEQAYARVGEEATVSTPEIREPAPDPSNSKHSNRGRPSRKTLGGAVPAKEDGPKKLCACGCGKEVPKDPRRKYATKTCVNRVACRNWRNNHREQYNAMMRTITARQRRQKGIKERGPRV